MSDKVKDPNPVSHETTGSVAKSSTPVSSTVPTGPTPGSADATAANAAARDKAEDAADPKDQEAKERAKLADKAAKEREQDEDKAARIAAKDEKLGNMEAAKAIREEAKDMDRSSVVTRVHRKVREALEMLREAYPPMPAETLPADDPHNEIAIAIRQLAELAERLRRAGAVG